MELTELDYRQNSMAMGQVKIVLWPICSILNWPVLVLFFHPDYAIIKRKRLCNNSCHIWLIEEIKENLALFGLWSPNNIAQFCRLLLAGVRILTHCSDQKLITRIIFIGIQCRTSLVHSSLDFSAAIPHFKVHMNFLSKIFFLAIYLI